jgi:hypothetical protein
MNTHPLLARLAAISGLVATVGLLLGLGPLLGTGHEPVPWLRAIDDPVHIAIELVRAASLGGAIWLLALTVLNTVAGMLRLASLGALTQRFAPAFWRNLVLRPMASLVVVAPPVLLPVLALTPVAAEVSAVEDMPHLRMTSHQSPPTDLSIASEVPTLTMRVHTPDDPSASDDAHHLQGGGGNNGATDLPTDRSGIYIVASGDNLWSIAAAHLTTERGARPTAAEVTPYWRALIEANRDALPDPDNPDLLFPGIELRLPPAG